jgi:hypothetical protein
MSWASKVMNSHKLTKTGSSEPMSETTDLGAGDKVS